MALLVDEHMSEYHILLLTLHAAVAYTPGSVTQSLTRTVWTTINGWPCSLQVQLLQDRWRLRTLHAIVPAWRSLIAAQAASRSRLRQTLQRVYLQRLLQAWHMHASRRVQLKIVAFSSWKQAVVWQQRKPLLLCTALSHYDRRYERCAKNTNKWCYWWLYEMPHDLCNMSVLMCWQAL